MFEVHCHVHESSVLLDWSRVDAMRHTPEGPVLDWHCWCGARGSLIAGSRSEPRPVGQVLGDARDRADIGDIGDTTPIGA